MAVPVTQGSEARLLQEGINAVATIEYSDYPMEYSNLFVIYTNIGLPFFSSVAPVNSCNP